MTLITELRSTACPFRPTLLRWARAIDNGCARRIAEEMRAYATGDWPGIEDWRGKLLTWADDAEEVALEQMYAEDSMGYLHVAAALARRAREAR